MGKFTVLNTGEDLKIASVFMVGSGRASLPTIQERILVVGVKDALRRPEKTAGRP